MGHDRDNENDENNGDNNTIGRAIGDFQTLQASGNAAGGSSRVPSPFEKFLASRAQAARLASGAAAAVPARGAASSSFALDGDFVSITLDDPPSGSRELATGQDFREGPTFRRPGAITGLQGHTWDLPKATRLLWRGAMRQNWSRLAVCGIAALVLFANLFMSIGFAVCQGIGEKRVETGVWVWLWGSLGLFLLVLLGFGFLWWRDGQAVNKIEEDEVWIGGKAPGGVVAAGGEGTGVGAGKREDKGNDKGKEVVKSLSRQSLLGSSLSEPGKPVGSSGEGTGGLGCRPDTQHSISYEMYSAAPQTY
ncbi:hypothetical protein QBC41DRAFT_381760 [Cercophora samala]|uniref:Transmembrane protein n=1 Tax=Cercophora samala TaxID=330535 RepID=A0AA39Z1R5_9PEZI|nr:hypothetical protein QBC41DRAFT_381760 [Cercophora samala]